MDDESKNTASDRNDNESSKVVIRGPFKWFVLVTFFVFSSSLATSELIFAPIPKQMAAYYGIKGKYFNIRLTKRIYFGNLKYICIFISYK